ncbi:hypothetical protein [Nocardia sp. NPDC057272]|uniref:hypothetical protein n=1 Tax=Nocardia sp. NPDC057272 TaxID=3346079 RepID=UPI003632EF7C
MEIKAMAMRWMAVSTLVLGTSATTLTGCDSLNAGESVEVASEPTGWDAPFSQLLASHNSSKLGDVVRNTGVPVEEWDKLYSFTGDASPERVNDTVGIGDIEWVNRSRSTDVTMHVFVSNGKVVYAFNDQQPRNGATSGAFSTPTATVTPRAIERGYPTNDTVWVLDISGGE